MLSSKIKLLTSLALLVTTCLQLLGNRKDQFGTQCNQKTKHSKCIYLSNKNSLVPDMALLRKLMHLAQEKQAQNIRMFLQVPSLRKQMIASEDLIALILRRLPMKRNRD